MPDKDGIPRVVPCDKVAIAQVMWGLMKAKLDHLRVTNKTDAYRKWCGFMPHVMEGLPWPEEADAFVPSSVEEFLRLYRFQSPNDEEGKHGSGYTPLTFAALSGNVPVAQALLEEHGADPLTTTRRFDVTLGFDKDVTPLHAAMYACPR